MKYRGWSIDSGSVAIVFVCDCKLKHTVYISDDSDKIIVCRCGKHWRVAMQPLIEDYKRYGVRAAA